MEKRAKHGKRVGGRRLIVSLSLTDDVLMTVEEMQRQLGRVRGRIVSRSETIKWAIRVARAAMIGEDVSDLRRF